MKTLFVSPQVPWPLDVGSKIRLNNLLRCYAEMGPVTLACFGQDQFEMKNSVEVERYCHRVHCLPLGIDKPMSTPPAGAPCRLRHMLDPSPSMVRYFWSAEFNDLVGSLVSDGDFDILHVARLSMAQYVGRTVGNQPSTRHPYLVLDVDDLESCKMKRMAELEPWSSLRKYLHLIELIKVQTCERLIIPRYNCVLVCSERDRQSLRTISRSPRVEVFCNGAEVEDHVTSERRVDDGHTLVYLGAMNYKPNEDAVLYFVESVYPLIRLQVPKVTLIIAGKSPSPGVRSLENGHDVFVTGYVKDKPQLFDACTIFIVPIRIGGGTRIKILEAMAAGKPVVSTSIGCEGIEVTPNQDIVVADTAEDFANACVSLLRSEVQRQAIGRCGRNLVVNRYRWEEIRAGYVRTLEQSLGRTASAMHQRRTGESCDRSKALQ